MRIIGGCPCGVADIDTPDELDSGMTLQCSVGHSIVFDVGSPKQRAALLFGRPEDADDGTTHHPHCWQGRRHHECAIARVNEHESRFKRIREELDGKAG